MVRVVEAVPIIILLLIVRDSVQIRPAIAPETDQIVKNEGDLLEIVCSGFSKLYFIYPQTSTMDGTVITSRPDEREYEEDGIYKYEFKRKATIYGDTGWYGCSNHPVTKVTEETYLDPDIAWIYAYIQSNQSAFVETGTLITLWAVSGETKTIPCRPTSPEYNVTLLNDDGFEVQLGDRVSYDPRFGFTIKNVTLLHHAYYSCSILLNGEEHAVSYNLFVLPKTVLPDPKIIDDPLRHVTRGQTLRVNCTVDIEVNLIYAFNWTTPQRSSRISTRQYSAEVNTNTKRVTTELIIQNVMDDDEGDYKCTLTTFNENKKVSRYIVVNDPGMTFINLTSQDSIRHYHHREGDRVQWVVYVHAHPAPQLEWLNTKGGIIDASWKEPEKSKYAINTTPISTILRINYLEIDDMGVYSLLACTPNQTEMLNFTLYVMAKPIPMLEKLETYYKPNQKIDLKCVVAAFPMPNITLSYYKCPYYASQPDNCSQVPLMFTPGNRNNNGMLENEIVTKFPSIARLNVEHSGYVSCTACNKIGCDSAIQSIFVSDGDGGFGIMEPRAPVIEGDNLDLICAASVYNYTSQIQWSYENISIPIEQSDRVKIITEVTPFTYRAILRILDIKKEDGKYYVCTGRTKGNISEEAGYTVQVERAKPPYFISKNMNETELTIDPYTEDFKKDVLLQCFASGMPRPNVTWYKDGALLNRSDHYEFQYSNQQLRITYPRERDSGKYSCLVANRVGKLQANQTITIKGKQLPVFATVLIIVLVIIVVFLIIFFIIKIRREKTMRKELMEAGLMHFEEGALECLNPDLTVDDQAELLPYDKKWEFPRERLKLGKKLGSGAFGVVMKAEAQGICDEEAVTTVAVKMVRRTTDPTYVRALASELKIMVHLGKHLNVVNLLGACTKNISKRELLVIVEYCRFGNLHNYLLRHRADFINQIDPASGKFDPTIGLEILNRTLSISSNNSLSANSGTESVHYTQGTGVDSQGVSMSPDGCVLSNNSSQPGWRSNYRGDYKDQNLKPICTQDLLSWAFQVARGMEYLSQRKVLHGDLAARNILLAENNVVKICDFGLAKTMYKDDNYKKKGDGPLPIKWMAIESIRDRIFSTQSDIWSFGIVLWEFFTLAETPYPGMEAEKQYQKLIEGYRMEQPEYATSEVYDIMLQCWKAKPTLRPSFTELVDSIGDLLEESVRSHYVSLNAPYMDMNTMILEAGKKDYLTMMTAPDHDALSSPTHEYVNSPLSENPPDSAYLCMSPSGRQDESGIFSPRPHEEETHFDFPSPTSDSEDAVELSPMLKKVDDDDPYLKPINVHERRAEFARQRQALKNQATERFPDRDSGYCNTPRNLHLIDLNEKNEMPEEEEVEAGRSEVDSKTTKKDFTPTIIRTPDNYVNMPKQKSDLRREMPDGFSNPSYVMMGHRELDQAKA